MGLDAGVSAYMAGAAEHTASTKAKTRTIAYAPDHPINVETKVQALFEELELPYDEVSVDVLREYIMSLGKEDESD